MASTGSGSAMISMEGTEAATAPALGGDVTLQLVLLLMDPKSRRFELLQLEFDSDQARVADIIQQIPISVTEADIRSQNYDCVLDESATLRGQDALLLDCEKGVVTLVGATTENPSFSITNAVLSGLPAELDEGSRSIRCITSSKFICNSFTARVRSRLLQACRSAL